MITLATHDNLLGCVGSVAADQQVESCVLSSGCPCASREVARSYSKFLSDLRADVLTASVEEGVAWPGILWWWYRGDIAT